jgi:CRISPR-associated protein Cmr1
LSKTRCLGKSGAQPVVRRKAAGFPFTKVVFLRVTLNSYKKSITTRSFIESGYFSVNLLFKPISLKSSADEIQKREKDISGVQRAFWAMSMFGGIGARSRKGFGSVVPIFVEGMDGLPSMIVEGQNDLENSLVAFFEKCQTCPNESRYTIFTNNSRCFILGASNSCNDFLTGENCLEWLGKTILSYRSYRGEKKKTWVIADHDLVAKYVHQGTEPNSAPKRAIFGLPHNYFFSSSRSGAELNILDADKKGRRSSPLFFKVYQFEKSKKCCAIMLFLPSQFLPANSELTFSTKNAEIVHVPPPSDFTPITDLMDALGDENGKEVSWSII